jgi:8-oxo-dGTP diphosphatase
MKDDLHRALLRVYRALPAKPRRWVVRLIAPKYTVGAICFLERPDGAVLFVRLAYREGWGVPGGLLKRGEEPADAVKREVREEVGLDVELVGEPAIVVDARPQRIDVVFRARLAPYALVADMAPHGPEILEARWFAPDAFPELQFEAANALVALARSARSPQAVPIAGPTSWFSRRDDLL